MMGKPENAVYERFTHKYEEINKRLGLKQYLVPYLMSSHPGSTMKEAVKLAEYLRDLGYMPEQVQILPDTVYDFHLYVLYRCRSADDEAGVCAEESA